MEIINSISLIPLISAFFVLGLGFFVFIKNRKLKLNVIFFLISIVVSVWLFGTFMMFNSQSDDYAIFWDRFIYMGVVFVPALMYHFSVVFTKIKPRKNIIALGYFFSFIFLFLSQTEYFVSDLFRYEWGVHTQARIFHHIFLLFFSCFLVLTLKIFYQHYKDKSLGSLERERAKYVFFAFFVLISIGSTAFAPAYGFGIYPFSYLSGLIFTIILAYAILKYRLMDIRLALTRGIIYINSLSIIVGFSFFLMFLSDKFFEIIPFNITASLVLIIGISLFHPVLFGLEKLASRYFYYAFYDYRSVLNDLGKKLTRILDLDKLSHLITDTLIDTMKLDRAVILLRNQETGDYKIEKNIGFREENGISLVTDNFLTEYLEKTQKPLVYDEISLAIRDAKNKKEEENLERLKDNMKRIEANLCLPLLIKDKIIGMVVLGDKASGDPYFEQDINLLIGLSNQASIALQNAILYSQVQNFSQELERKVEEQTGKLKRAYKELQASDKAKSVFISMASHQLRTPLTSLRGYTSMLLDGTYGKIPKASKEKIKIIMSSTERLIGIVNKLLSISKIDLGKLDAEKSKQNINELVNSCLEEMKAEGEQKGLDMIFRPSRIKKIEANVDSGKIKETITNIIENSIRYTDKGKIEVGVRKKKNSFVVYIKDTGEGLEKDEKENIFGGFTRGKAGLGKFIEGTGLGLYLSKKYIELHSGKIWAESKGIGKGSTFYIEIPF